MTRVVEIAQEVLQIPSYSGQEKNLRLAIAHMFEAEGIETITQNRNLLVHMTGTDSSRALIFNSHMDVVDIGNRNLWTHDPWGATISDGKIYGRGASDMKGGLAASIESAIRLSKEVSLPTDIWFTYVFKEEINGAGTESFARWFDKNGFTRQYRDMAAIFTEPTSLTFAEHGHRGNYFIEATRQGDSGHSGRPHEIKTKAINDLILFLTELESLNSAWDGIYHDSIFSAPTITPTSLRAKSKSWNKTPDIAIARLDLRTIPEFHAEAYDAVVALAEQYHITLTAIESATGFTPPDATIIQALQRVIPNLQLKVSEASADLGTLTRLQVNGVIFGPGDNLQSHQVDESASIEEIERAPDVFTAAYNQWAAMT